MATWHEECCPYCSRVIRVSYGEQRCPECRGQVRVYPDLEDAVSALAKAVVKGISISDLLRRK